MDVPVNVNTPNPSICPPGWEKEAEMWSKLNEEIGGHPDFYPLTIKGAYVIGVIHDICTCTNVLLNSNTPVETSFLPAYGIFASGVELLGRCINGNSFDNKSMKDLKIGFKWLGENGDYLSIKDTDPIVKTRMREYSALDLSFLRHYAAHGQAILNATIYEIDVDLLEMLRQKFAKSLENFWHGILTINL